MRLLFKISKLANFYFFIDNFSERKAYMRKNYNLAWLKILGQLTNKERRALKEWTAINEKIEKNKQLKQFTEIFYQIDDQISTFKKLQKFLNEDLEKLKNIFQIFERKFKKIWKRYARILWLNKTILKNDFKKVKKNLNQSLTILSKIYGVKNWPSQIQIFLIISPIPNSQGGRSISPNKIAVEFNKLDPQNAEQLEKAWNLILHELTHSLFETQEYKNWIKSYISNKKKLDFPIAKKLNLSEIMRECIMRCFLSNLNENGLRNEKSLFKIVNKEYFQNKLKDKKFFKEIVFKPDFIKTFIAWKLTDLSKKYITNKKRIDKKFLEAIFKLLKDYPKNINNLSK